MQEKVVGAYQVGLLFLYADYSCFHCCQVQVGYLLLLFQDRCCCKHCCLLHVDVQVLMMHCDGVLVVGMLPV